MDALHTNYGYNEFNTTLFPCYGAGFNVSSTTNMVSGVYGINLSNYKFEIDKLYDKESHLMHFQNVLDMADRNNDTFITIYVFNKDSNTNPYVVWITISADTLKHEYTSDVYCYDNIADYSADYADLTSSTVFDYKEPTRYHNKRTIHQDYTDVSTLELSIFPVYDTTQEPNPDGNTHKASNFIGFDIIYTSKRSGNEIQVFASGTRFAIIEGDYKKFINNQEDNNKADEGADGGFGSYDNTSDNIEFPSLPNVNLVSPMSRLYMLTEEQYQNFGSWVWDDSFSAQLLKVFDSPSEAIISIGLVAYTRFSGDIKQIVVGNLATGINATSISNWFSVPCGQLSISEYYGNYIDYNPTTQCTLYLPFIGFIDIDTDVIMNNYIEIQYSCDLLSGKGVCHVLCENRRNGHRCIYLAIPCVVMTSVPLSLLNKSEMVASYGMLVGGGIAAVATGGATAAVTTAVAGGIGVMKDKEHYSAISGQGDTSGIMGYKKPYLIIKRQTYNNPSLLKSTSGYMLATTDKIGNKHGFTKIADCHVDIARTTEEEKEEILRLLKEGIVL